MVKLEEMDRFLEKFNLPRLNQEETEIMDNPVTSTETEAVDVSLGEILELVMDREDWCASWGHKESDMTERLN